MTTKQLREYRLRVTDHQGVKTYVVRDLRGNVTYISADETPLALSNLVSKDAAELRFAFQDALDGTKARRALVEVLAKQWARNRLMTPTVEIL